MANNPDNTITTTQTLSSLHNYMNSLESNISLQNESINQLNDKNAKLIQKQQIQMDQLKEIQDKEKLLLTRSRMLQISQDRNAYKKKIIYTLIALIFAIFIITLVVYVLYTRKLGTAK